MLFTKRSGRQGGEGKPRLYLDYREGAISLLRLAPHGASEKRMVALTGLKRGKWEGRLRATCLKPLPRLDPAPLAAQNPTYPCHAVEGARNTPCEQVVSALSCLLGTIAPSAPRSIVRSSFEGCQDPGKGPWGASDPGGGVGWGRKTRFSMQYQARWFEKLE